MPPVVKGFSAIIKKYHGIDTAMNDQKSYQKKARKAHREFFTKRRSEKMFPGHKAIVVNVNAVTKIRCMKPKKELIDSFCSMWLTYLNKGRQSSLFIISWSIS